MLLPAALIVVAGMLAYSNSFTGLFVLDEQTAIIENPNIRSLATAFSAPPEVGFAGRPVGSLTFALNYALAPAPGREAFTPPPPGYPPEAWALLYRNLWGYHAVNLAIHLLAALVLFGVVRRTLLSPRLADRFGPAATPLATAIALIWVVHPLCTSSITYVAQRLESLMALFFLLTVYCAIRSAPDPETPASSPLWTVAAVAFCALGMGTKEVMVSAPLTVALWDFVFLAPALPRARIWTRRWRLYAVLAATWVLLAWLVIANPRTASIGFGLKGWTSWLYLQTQAAVIVHYLRLAIVPWPLVLDYDWPAATSLASVLPQMVLLGALLGLTGWGLLRRQPVAFPGAVFFLVLAPSSSVVPIVTEVAAEHRMYLPLAAVVTVVVLGVYRLVATRASRPPAGARNGRRDPARARWRAGTVAAGLAVGLLVLAFGRMSYLRNEDYQNEERIWADTVQKRPGNARARSNYATVLAELGRDAEAERQLRAAVALQPDYTEAQANLGATLCKEGKLDEGIAHLRRALELQPDYGDAQRNLGEALATLGRNAEAVVAFRHALRSTPGDVMLLDRVAWLLATSPEDSVRDGQAAVTLAEKARDLTGGRNLRALDTLAAAYAEAGRFDEAVATAGGAVALARQQGSVDAVNELEFRLDLYKAGRKYRQPPPGQ